MTNPPRPDDPTVIRPKTIEPTTPTPAPAVPSPHAAAAPGGGNALPVGTFLDEFELRSVAGEGGFSIVYRAWDHSLNRQVAVKEYFPSGLAARVDSTQISVRSERHRETFEAGLRSFVEEARLLAHFDHPALIKVYRFWKANGSAYMVMPFCEGITLRDEWKNRADPPDEAELLTILGPVTEALTVLHAEHWYHRDIAPDNVILLAGSKRPLLLDFGAARQVIGDMTHALTVILKPGYAPIEQWGEVPGMKQGPWTDVYALGAMLHFGIMRKTPPPSVGRLVNDNYQPLAQVAAGRYSAAFLEAVDRALIVRPEERTQSIEQFRAEIGLGPVARDPASAFVAPPPPAPGAATQRVPQDPMPATERVARPAEPQTMQVPPPAAPRQPLHDDITVDPRTQPALAAADTSRRPLLLGGAALALAAAGFGAWTMLRPRAPQPAPQPPSAQASAVPAPPAAASAVAAAPAPTPAPTPAPAPAPTAYDPIDQFGRAVAGQTPGFTVEVALARTTMRSDKDKLGFTVQSQRDGFIYVFNHGSDGELLQLYPHALSGKVRVKKGEALRLPLRSNANKQADEFVVSGPPGTSALLVMVSTHERSHAAFQPEQRGDFKYFPAPARAAELAARHPGPLPLIAGVPICPDGGTCADEYGAALVSFTVVK